MIKGFESKRHKKLNTLLASLSDLMRHVIIKYDYFFEKIVEMKIDIFRDENKRYSKIISAKHMRVIYNRVAVIIDNDKNIRILNLKDPTKDFKLIGSEKIINCICILSNNRIVSGSEDGTLIVWDLEIQKAINEFSTGKKITLLLSMNNNTFINVSYKTLKVYSLDNQKYPILQTNSAITCLTAVSLSKVITGHFNSLTILDINTGVKEVINTHSPVYFVFGVPSHNLVIIGLKGNILLILDIVNKTEKLHIKIRRHNISDCALLSENKVLISFLEGTLVIFNCITNVLEKEFTDNDDFIKAVDTLSDGRIVSAGRDHYLKIWG